MQKIIKTISSQFIILCETERIKRPNIYHISASLLTSQCDTKHRVYVCRVYFSIISKLYCSRTRCVGSAGDWVRSKNGCVK